MKPLLTVTFVWLAALLNVCQASSISLSAPLEHQVTQRQPKNAGILHIAGTAADAELKLPMLEARIVSANGDGDWRKIAGVFHATAFEGDFPAPAGGWHRLEVRLLDGNATVGTAVVEHVGVGEVFVVAGQSNSANYGAEKQETQTGKVATFDGKAWQLANDPQPGAGGKGGSFMPPLGDALVKQFDVPVGFIACGIGATSVREWLPKGSRFPNPPTIESRVTKLPDGQWESNGEAFANFVARQKQLGPHGFRAVLWHQGESDAHQKDDTRTLPGKLYRQYLEQLIVDSRKEIGWDAPWFVAQASYHNPRDDSSADIRAAQASLWADGIALQGPDSDALKGDLREKNGQGVHFAGPGLREHAAKWAEKIGPWLEKQLEIAKAQPGR